MRKETVIIRFILGFICFWMGLLTFRYFVANKKSKMKSEKLYESLSHSGEATPLPNSKNVKSENENVELHEIVGNNQTVNIRNEDTTTKTSYPLVNVYAKPMTKLEIREQLGRSTWTLLHTMAAVYPGLPSEDHKKDTLKFIYLLSKLYPCGDCAQHFQKLIAGFPPKVGNHDEFAEWLCKAHNVVNGRLNKEQFDCKRVDERWECGCEHDNR